MFFFKLTIFPPEPLNSLGPSPGQDFVLASCLGRWWLRCKTCTFTLKIIIHSFYLKSREMKRKHDSRRRLQGWEGQKPMIGSCLEQLLTLRERVKGFLTTVLPEQERERERERWNPYKLMTPIRPISDKANVCPVIYRKEGFIIDYIKRSCKTYCNCTLDSYIGIKMPMRSTCHFNIPYTIYISQLYIPPILFTNGNFFNQLSTVQKLRRHLK